MENPDIQPERHNGAPAGLTALIMIAVITLAGLSLLYCLFGHAIIRAAYCGKNLGFLNRIIEGQSAFAVDHYYTHADRLMWRLFRLGSFFLALLVAAMFAMRSSRALADSVRMGLAAGLLSLLFSNFQAWRTYNRYFTQAFIDLSLSPLDGNNPLLFRTLVPSLAWMTRINGELFYLVPIAGTLLFLVSVHYWAQSYYGSVRTATLITLALAFLPLVQFTYVFAWVDTFCYLFLVLALLNPRVCTVYILLGVLTHEMFVFYVPFVYAYHYRYNRSRVFGRRFLRPSQAMAGISVILVYAAIRAVLASSKEGGCTATRYLTCIEQYGLSYPFKQPLVLSFLAAYEMAAFLLIPAGMAFTSFTRRMRYDTVILAASLALSASTLFIAHDTTRMWSHTFFVICLLPRCTPVRTRNRWLVTAAVCNILVPTFYFGIGWEAPLDRHARVVKEIYLQNRDIRTLTGSPRHIEQRTGH